MVAAALTSLPGSSAYFQLGVVVYSNRAKSTVLGIPAKIITSYGAVSSVVCRQMAHSVRRLAQTDFGIGITGIAGPAGAVKGKPVGTVYIAVSGKRKTTCSRFSFRGNRNAVREQSSAMALKMLAAALRTGR